MEKYHIQHTFNKFWDVSSLAFLKHCSIWLALYPRAKRGNFVGGNRLGVVGCLLGYLRIEQ